MTNEPKVDLDNENQEGENLENQKEVDTPEDEVKISKKEYQSLLAQKEHWREKAKINEATKLAPEKSEVKEPVKESYDPLESVKLLNALKDFSQDEIDLISRQAKANGVNLLEAAKLEDVQLLIQAKREKIKNEQANPIPGTRQEPAETDFSKWTKDDITKMSQNPSKENLGKMTQYIAWVKSQK